MIAAAWLLLAAAALGAVGAGDERLDRALGGLEDADPHRRREAALDLRHALRPEDAARLLDARSRAAPNGAAALEQLLVEVALLRGELLRLALAGDDRAVELLTAAFAARAGELAPLRLDLAELRERRLPWTRSGWRAVRSGAPGATLQLPELLAALRGAGCLAQPVVVQAGCLADGILAPFAADVALDAWLEIELSRRDRVVRRGVVAAWVLPPKEADGDRLLDGEKEGIELLQLCERECGWFRAALLAARALPTAAGWRDGCGLLLRCGLELPAGAIPDAAAARVVAEVRAEWLAPPSPLLPSADAAVGAVAVGRAELLARLEARVEAVAAAAPDSGAGDPAAFAADLRRLVDIAASGAAADAILCGELADRMRRLTARLPAPALVAAGEAAAAELFVIGRAARPPSGRVVLPPGKAPQR